MSKKLQSYLKTHRKRSGLTQDEVAYLLECKSGENISRHERLKREPSLNNVLAYQAVFGVTTQELFSGKYDLIEKKVKRLVRLLVQKLSKMPQNRKIVYKLARLKEIHLQES